MKKITRISILAGVAAFACAAQEATPKPVLPSEAEMRRVEDALERAAEAVDHVAPALAKASDPLGNVASKLAELNLKMALSADVLRDNQFGLLAQAQPPQPAAAPQPAQAPQPPQAPQRVGPGWKGFDRDRDRERRSEEQLYRTGTRNLDRREYNEAVEAFDAAASKKGTKADGALYWKAYALAKLGRRDEAVAAINDLEKLHPGSRWLNDAKALAVEVRQASGQSVSPESQGDEELKLMALNALMQSDPERAVPMLEKILSRGGSPKLKEQALFVLAQSRTPEARNMLVEFAKGKGNPDLQMKAVEYLGIHGGSGATQVLSDVYASSTDPALKRRILQSFMVARDKDRILNAARSEPNPELRREAINLLGVMRAQPELVQMYASESNVEVREAILQGLFVGGAHDKIIELAKTEKDPKLRRQAIHHLGTMRRQDSSDALVALYGTESDPKIKREILQAFFVQGNATKIVELARQETDPQVKREAVEKLSHMKSKEATDFLLELLNK